MMSFTISAFAARPMATGMHHPETRRAERFPKIPTGAPRAVRACGKKSGEIKSLLKADPGVTKVDVHYSPFWVNKAPSKPAKLTIIFQKASS